MPVSRPSWLCLLPGLLILSGCHGHDGGPDGKPGKTIDGPTASYAGIGANEVLHLAGTEPFWGGSLVGSSLTWTTPENPQGRQVQVTRRAGNNGLGFSGMLGGQKLDVAISAATCSDGMSDRTYPFSVSVLLGAEQRFGCAWTDARPPVEPKASPAAP